MVPPALSSGLPEIRMVRPSDDSDVDVRIPHPNLKSGASRLAGAIRMIDRAYAWTQRMRLTFETRFASRRSRDSQTARLERQGRRRGDVLHHACPCRRAACVVRPRRRVSRRKYQNRTTCSPLFLGPSSVRDNLGALRGAPVFGPDERVQIWTKHAEIWGPRPDVGSPQVTMKFSRVRWDCSLPNGGSQFAELATTEVRYQRLYVMHSWGIM
ncbi:hypothetical protein OH76DRAFT_702341 [Lentinus brumalis]|uniref:Uncharacterized protein n=1 Tax=Lentinus brumalis TaxID=2498619 RepID=A0A371D5P1_9APHY|nr:hypothetical protein OH76DRAFT_702341 [Polyporus brumalis]